MRKCNEQCEYFTKLANTDECGSALCTYTASFFPIEKESDCIIIPKDYTCGDCDRLNNDDWCFTCQSEDSAYHGEGHNLCCGFIDKHEANVLNALCDWSLRGYDIEEKLNKVLEQFRCEFKPLTK